MYGSGPALLLWRDYWLTPEELSVLRSEVEALLPPDATWTEVQTYDVQRPIEPEDRISQDTHDAMAAFLVALEKSRREEPAGWSSGLYPFNYRGKSYQLGFSNVGYQYIEGVWHKHVQESRITRRTTAELLDLAFSHTGYCVPGTTAGAIAGRLNEAASRQASEPFLTILRKTHPYTFYSATEGRKTA